MLFEYEFEKIFLALINFSLDHRIIERVNRKNLLVMENYLLFPLNLLLNVWYYLLYFTRFPILESYCEYCLLNVSTILLKGDEWVLILDLVI